MLVCYKAGEVYLLQSGWYHGTVIYRLSSLLSIAVWRRDGGLFYFAGNEPGAGMQAFLYLANGERVKYFYTSPLAIGYLLAVRPKDMSIS